MKSLILLTLFASIGANAAEINLSAGSSAVITANETTRVSCEGAQDVAPRCTVKLESGYYRVYIGSNPTNMTTTVDDAIIQIKKLQAASICR